MRFDDHNILLAVDLINTYFPRRSRRFGQIFINETNELV